MASKRELSTVSTSSLPQKLHTFLANAACKVFNEFKTPNAPPEENVVQQELVGPLQWLLCGGDPAVVFAGLEEHRTPSNFCGKVFKSGEPAYFCKDCQTDPTCCLCMECFERSGHKNHRYRLYASGGGGCCDCGDPEAWTDHVHCQIHMPTKQNEKEVDPVEVLSSDLADRARRFFSTLLWYGMDLLLWTTPNTLPQEILQGKTAECLQEDTFVTFLYNDEVHSYDEVIFTLTHNIKLTHTEATALATYVDRTGRAVAKCGTENDCQRSMDVINRGLASNSELNVKMLHSVVAAHQSNAILCLSLLKELAEKSAAFRRLISEALVEVSFRPNNPCILDRFFLNDSHMWIKARISWHRLLMSSIFMDPLYKKDLAINITKNYYQLQENFVADSHHHDVCASNMTVQLFTVPSLSRMLVAKHKLLQTILDTILKLLQPCVDPDSGVLKLNSPRYKHSRMGYTLYDLRYVLRNKPEEWTEELRTEVMAAAHKLLQLLSLIQNVDAVKRQRGFHVEREEPWEHMFNFSIVLQPAVLLFADWCITDRFLLCEVVKATLAKHTLVGRRNLMLYKSHSVDQSLVGRKTMELIVFDILKEHVSVHQPLPRLLASLLTGASIHNIPLMQLLQISPSDTQTPLFLMEHSARVIVMAVQVLAGMWKRNGYSVVNQVINYQFHYSREVMYDKDVIMLQAMASIMDPSMFLYAFIYKFRLEKWITSPESDPVKRGEPTEDALRFFISEVEEFLNLIIIIFSERYSPGVGQGVTVTDSLKREIIHRLYITPLSHSEVVKQFRMSENENEIDQILKEVANLKPGAGGSRSVFELKPTFEKDYSPFFFHYNRMDHSKAEDAYRRRVKAAGGAHRVIPTPPRHPPPFCEPFQPVLRLTCCPVVHRVLHCVFKLAASAESKFWSDKLLHAALHMCALMLSEECATTPNSLCNAAIGRAGSNPFLEHLESLLTNRRAEEHRSLLTWAVQYLRNARDHGPGGVSPIAEVAPAMPEEEEEMEEEEPPSDENSTQRKELAKAQRERLMAKMSAMQKKFLEDHRQEIEDVVDAGNIGNDEPDHPGIKSTAPPPRCAVGVASLLGHTPSPQEVTCILCQEETKDFASQERGFVQAVHVQRSAVLRRCKPAGEIKDLDLLSARADVPIGTYSSGCGHHMHAECWRRFLESKQQEHGRRHFFPLPGQSVQWQLGEFLCPLCQCYSNTVLPLLPHIKVPTEVTPPCKELGFLEWAELVNLALELAETPEEEQGTSVDPDFQDKLQSFFPSYSRPNCTYNKRGSFSEQPVSEQIGVFSQAVYMRAYCTDPDESSDNVCVAQWNNCAYTIASWELNAQSQGKFLLESLSCRQLDSIQSLVRLGCEAKVRPKMDALAKYLREFTNSFLLQSPPFTELPCILEIDGFTMMVNLHFTLVSLYASLTSASGQLDNNLVVVPLMGLTDQCLAKVCAAAHTLQYLLTCPPAMETDAATASSSGGADSSPEHASGQALQKLWVKFRKLAQLSSDCPPSPYNLYVGVQEHLYHFLQCSALFFHSVSGINYIHSSATLASRFEDLCLYVGLPSTIHTLFDPPSPPARNSIATLAELWCSHPRLAQVATASTPPPVLVSPRQLLTLPSDYSELVKKASAFQCPNRVVDGEDGQAAMVCLVCGEMLCTNSYCCQHSEDDSDREGTIRIGGFTHHTRSCGAGMGMALWILESYVVLLDATDLDNVKGCTVTPPYLDEYGEPDPGLRHGNPLKLFEDNYRELKTIWFQHRVPERICKEMETNRGLMRINWARM